MFDKDVKGRAMRQAFRLPADLMLTFRRGGGNSRSAIRCGWPVRLVAFLGLLVGSLALAQPASALAGVGLGVTPLYPAQVTVGQTNVAAGLVIQNQSFGVGPVTLTSITFNPACKDTAPGSCALPDLGVISLSASGTGPMADACSGKTFTIAGPDVNGRGCSYVACGAAPVL